MFIIKRERSELGLWLGASLV